MLMNLKSSDSYGKLNHSELEALHKAPQNIEVKYGGIKDG